MVPKRFSERSLLLLCIFMGVVPAWIGRFSLNQDGISYLDMGDAYLRGDWAHAINAYWSPMYPWILGLALRLFHPSIWWENPVVHGVNLVIYIASLFCFRFFLDCVIRSLQDERGNGNRDCEPLPEWVIKLLGYGVFLWATVVLIESSDITPDLLIAAWVFLIAGYLVELRSDESYRKFAVFGLLCGFAYLSKTVMFLVSWILLAILLFSARPTKRRIAGVALAAALFLAVASPYIAALSRQKGRLTFGDSGKLAYASMVNPNVPQKHWQGDPPEGGIPKHTTRQLLDKPPVFEFDRPVIGTYPVWYDPSYWDDGARGAFRLRAQIRVLVQSARNYSKMLLGQLGLLAGIAIFVLWGGTAARKGILYNWPLIVAALVPMAMYSLVLVRSRYVGGFAALLFMGLLAGIRLPKTSGESRLLSHVTLAVAGTILFSVLAFLAEFAFTTLTVYSLPMPKDEIRAAIALQTMGLRPGDPVASIGDGTVDYWARMGRYHVVAEVFSPEPGAEHFWSESWERRKLVYETLRRTGAKAVIVWSPPEGVDPGWVQVGSTNYYMRFLGN
ncbi:MAG TPA: hypothetical protein VND65_06670 [Candidatus Binatia bacterium]|nr:hypothetical protein [Candidatus Binatia bacterium]